MVYEDDKKEVEATLIAVLDDDGIIIDLVVDGGYLTPKWNNNFHFSGCGYARIGFGISHGGL